MKAICLKSISSGGYIRVTEDCKKRNNLGLIYTRKDGVWLWVKEEPSDSGLTIYSSKDRPSFKPYKNNPSTTPRGGSGYLGGRKFSSLKSIEIYLGSLAQVKWC